MFKSTLQVTLFSIIGVVVTFITQLLMAHYFGATRDRDAFFAAITIPAYITSIFVGSICMMFLPFLVRYQTGDQQKQESEFVASVINSSFLLLFALIIVGCLFARPIMSMIVPLSKQEILETGIILFRIQLLSIGFTVLSQLLAATFHSRHSFIIPASFPLITGIIVLITVLFFSTEIGIRSIAYGTLAGSFLSFLFMFLKVLGKFQYRWTFRVFHPELKAVWISSIPLFGVGILFRSTNIFERFFAARLPEGSLSYLGSANQIIVLLSTLVSSGIATTSFPLLAMYWQQNDTRNLQDTFIKVIRLIAFIVLPMIVIFIVSGMDIIRILFEHGAFTDDDTTALYYTLLSLMGYFLFSSIGNITARMLYTSKKTWTTSLIALFELLVYLTTAFWLGKSYGYVGLALAISVSGACNIILSFIFIHKRVVSLDLRHFFVQIAFIVALSGLTLFLVFLFDAYLLVRMNFFVRGFVSSITVIIIYWLLSKWLIKDSKDLFLLTAQKQNNG